MAANKRRFEHTNKRRHELINKMHSGFTEEESMRKFEGNPGWKEECERRYKANLTDEEHKELEFCTAIVDDYLAANFPKPLPPNVEELNVTRRTGEKGDN